MLAHRVIPTVLLRGQQLVKGKQFQSWRSVGHAAQAARIYAARGCDEIILLDIAATPEGRGPDLDMVRVWTENNFSPITVGGGVRSADDVRALLAAGADKVAIGTCVGIIDECARRFGSQAVVLSIDCYYVPAFRDWDVGGYRAVDWAKICAEQGAGEILLTSIDREGTIEGYDLDLIRKVSAAVDIPVIAHGGCGTPQHMLEAIQAGASAVAVGAMFQFTDVTPKDCARYLVAHDVAARV